VILTKIINDYVVNNRQMCKAFKIDKAHLKLKSLDLDSFDRTIRVSNEDNNRQFFNVLKTNLVCVSILKERKDIYDRNVFNEARKIEYIV